MKSKYQSYGWVIAGLLLLGAGLYLIKGTADPQGVMKTLPYILIGLGCGIFGHGMGDLISRHVRESDPATARQIDIEQNDERNVAVSNRAKAKAYDLMLSVFGALMIAFALMGVELTAVLLLVAAYLFVVACFVYYRMRFEKEM